MKRTHRNLLLLNYAITLKEEDNFFYCEWHQLKKYLSRNEIKSIIKIVRSNPRMYRDTGLTHIVTEDNGYVSNVEMFY